MRSRIRYPLGKACVASFTLCATFVALVLPTSRVAFAAPNDARMREVKKACAGGDVDKGVKLLAELYAETNDPIAIYNQGRCYQQNGEPEKAANRFREYLRKARDLSPADRSEVEGFIREADAEATRRAERAAQAAAQAQPAPAPAAPAPVAPPATTPAPGWGQAPQGYPPGSYPQGNYPPGSYPPGSYTAPYPQPAPARAAPAAPVRASRKKGLMIGGFITLGVSYLLTALVGSAMTNADAKTCANCKTVGEAFYIPVFGPWTVYKDEASGGPDVRLPAGYKREDLDGVAVVSGVAQGVGLTLSVIGVIVFAASGKPAQPKTAATATTTATAFPVFTPLPGGGYGGLRGTF